MLYEHDLAIRHLDGPVAAWAHAPLRFRLLVSGRPFDALLLDAGADTEANDSGGRTPLHFAAFQNSKDMARILLEHGAATEAKDNYGKTPLHAAASNGLSDV